MNRPAFEAQPMVGLSPWRNCPRLEVIYRSHNGNLYLCETKKILLPDGDDYGPTHVDVYLWGRYLCRCQMPYSAPVPRKFSNSDTITFELPLKCV